jgi:hypothetical protein
MTRQYFAGMGQAVADRTINRKGEDWSDVATRVAHGNAAICGGEDEQSLRHHLLQASILMSGRHLQHGDADQPNRNLELFANCSTANQRSPAFYLLLNGSGVGSSYDDEICIVDFRLMPKVECIIDDMHQDVVNGVITGFGFDPPPAETYFRVPDSREGWAEALEQIEIAAYTGDRRDTTLVLDFSAVRPRGSPIGGMQGRPSSGPGPLMEAIRSIATLRDTDYEPWKAALYFDHYAAECVLVGGARRAARIAIKSWRDPGIFEFIKIKQAGDLWSANNSVGVDHEFWHGVKMGEPHATAVFNAVVEAQYHHGSGEPGFLNLDMLCVGETKPTLVDTMTVSGKYQLTEKGTELRLALAIKALGMRYWMIVNPCVTADTWVQTSQGPRRVSDLVGVPFEAMVNGHPHYSNGFWSTGVKEVLKIKTQRGYEMRLTSNHKVLTQDGWVQAGDLRPGDNLVLQRQDDRKSDVEEFKRGWAIGHITGDGSFNPSKHPTVMNFWPQDSLELVELAEAAGGRSHTGGVTQPVRQVTSRTLDTLCDGMITPLYKVPTPQLEGASASVVAGFVSGLFDADGCVQGDIAKGRSVRLDLVSLETLKTVQRMISRFGILSTIYEDRKEAGMKALPDGKGGMKDYPCQAFHTLMISRDNMHRFADRIGFMDPDKRAQLEALFDAETRPCYRDKGFSKVVSIEPYGFEEVFDCTVEDVHTFDANGLTSHNCGEIRISLNGGYCVIADVVPFHAGSDADATDAFKQATRALLRTNQLPALYQGEVDRTNRIGVGMTGLFEYAWARFGFGWKDLIEADGDVMWDANGAGIVSPSARVMPFWNMLKTWAEAVEWAAVNWCDEHGAAYPASLRTMKPAGTTSKLFGLTEAAHLPPMEEYLRWVQFRSDDPLVVEYAHKGYPTRELATYGGTTIVGFPTRPVICSLGMGDALITSPQATPDEQFRFLRLLETFWLGAEGGNQISYTLKYDPKLVSFEAYKKVIQENMPLIRAVSVMPTVDNSHYEYLPETAVTREEYDDLVANIDLMVEDIDQVHVDCSSGACPIDFNKAA